MNLAATFFISVYGLALLAGGILAWAEQVPSITGLTIPIAIGALWLNERARVLRLDGIWITVAGFAAFVFPAIEFFSGNEESRLLAIAHLLVILQWVLLFSRKFAHQYWWVCALSCLQVAVAAVLTSSPLFGLLILLYMFWAMWTLSVYTLLLARLRYGRSDELMTGEWVWPELHESVLQVEQHSTGSSLSRSEFRSSLQGDGREADLTVRFICGMFGISASSLLLGLVFFLLTPRLWIGASPFQDATLASTITSTGFSERVQLGDFGRILESSAPVLELQIQNEDSGQTVPLNEYLDQIGQTEPLLRGTVLAIYQSGSWAPHRTTPARPFNKRLSMFLNRNRKFYRQTIRLEPIGTRSLFSLIDPDYGRIEDQMGEILMVEESHTLRFMPFQSMLRGAVSYHLVTAERQRNSRALIYQTPGSPVDMSSAYTTKVQNCPFLDQLAQRLIAKARSDHAPQEPTRAQIADTIVKHLRDTGEYGYSLDQSVDDAKIDPIEDFLKNRKLGHCQYFATALALLLRSADIPTRVVTGFKGGVEDPSSGILSVQQRHAHTWVEALLDGNWVTLDATPPDARDESVAAIGDNLRWYHHLMMAGASIWNDYFLNLSYSKQQRDLYEPLKNLAGMVTSRLTGSSSFWKWLRATLLDYWHHPYKLFSVRGGLTAFFLMLTLAGIVYLLRFAWRLLFRLSQQAVLRHQTRLYIEFYERFLALLRPLGWVPEPSQTQLEFARQVEADWMSRQLPPEFASLAGEIALAFYQLRFGTDPLPPDLEERIQIRLAELESRMRRANT